MIRNDPYFLADQKRMLKRLVSGCRMSRLDSRPVPRDYSEIRLFMAVRNEMLRLPYVIKHHLNMGVDRVFVIDNGSTDGTCEWLLKQPNTHVYSTRESFLRKESWLDWILHKHGVGHWCLLLDADELLAYPHMEGLALPQLVSYLNSQSATALYTVLVDMYADCPAAKVRYREGDRFLDHAPFFDRPFYEKRSFQFRECRTPFQYRLCGGPRRRLFGEETNCTNFPLVKFTSKMFIRDGRHAVERAVVSEVRGALMHFKFFQDFAPKAEVEAQRGVHWENAKSYKEYNRYIRCHGDVAPYGADSLCFEGSSQLVKLNILQSTPELDAEADLLRTPRGVQACPESDQVVGVDGLATK